ncbi:MAG: hypothetical protein ABEJ31_05670 [Haloarculaceae archaeon]
MSRGQTSLPALAVALLVLVTTTGLGLAMADGAFAAADRQPAQRRIAVALSERLVSAASNQSRRTNVLNASRVDDLTERQLRAQYSVIGDRAVRIRLGERTLVDAGGSTGGATIRRIVLVSRTQARSYEPAFSAANATILPRRTERVRLAIAPPNGTTVQTVRANDRVVLRNASGLRGNFTVRTSRFETVRLTFETDRDLAAGDVRVRYFPTRTTKEHLEVTVGD